MRSTTPSLPRRRTLAALLALCASPLARADAHGDYQRALISDNARAMTLLMLRGFDPNTRDDKGRPGLVAAVQRDSLKVVDILLISPGIQVDLPSAQGETALMLACIKGHLALVQELLRRGSAVNRSGWAPLHYAASASHKHTPAIVQTLLRAGAQVNAPSPNASTALMLAAQYSSEAVVEQLLQAGANAALRNQQGLAAVDFARRANRLYLVKRLAKLNANKKP